MTLSKKITFLFSCIAIITGGLLFSFPAHVKADEATRKKARYYYLEGALREAELNFDQAYEYFKKAYETDPEYLDALYSYASSRIRLDSDTLQSDTELLKSLRMMSKYVDANPADLIAGAFYAYAAVQLDTVEEGVRVYRQLIDNLPHETTLLLQLADVYAMNREGEKALESLSAYENIEGQSEDVSLKKISIYLSQEDTINALMESDRLIRSNPSEPEFLLMKGRLHEVLGNPDSTFYYYTSAENLAPDNGRVKASLASYYISQGDSVMCDQKIYESLLCEDLVLDEKLGLLSDYLQKLIDEKTENGKGDLLFKALKEQYPHEPTVLDLSARYRAARNDFKSASEEIAYAIDQDPTKDSYWLQLMQYQFFLDDPELLKNTYERAEQYIEVLPSMTLIYAAGLNENGQKEAALEAYGSLIKKINPELPLDGSVDDTAYRAKLNYDELTRLSTYYNLLGDMYYSMGEIEKAYQAYDNSLFFYASNVLTLNNYAYFLAENGGDLDRAQEMSCRAIGEAENVPTYLDTYAWILFKKKDYKEALDYIELAIQIAEEEGEMNMEYYSHYGDILFMNHQPDKALENWKKALELEPDNALLKKKVENKTFFFE